MEAIASQKVSPGTLWKLLEMGKPANLPRPLLVLAAGRRKTRLSQGLWAVCQSSGPVPQSPGSSEQTHQVAFLWGQGGKDLTIPGTRGKFNGQSGGRACEGGTMCDVDPLSSSQTRAGGQEERPG